MKSINWVLAVLLSTVAMLWQSCAVAQNLVVNGDFSQGNTGFTTTYYSGGDLNPDNVYMIISNPSQHHPYGVNYGDHTTGNGLMMAVNGNDQIPVSEVWAETVAVQANKQYSFSAWVSQWTQYAPCGAQLQFAVNGTPVGPIFCVPDQPGTWERHEVTWASGSATSARLTILHYNQVLVGDDFAIDDIFFGSNQAEPKISVSPSSLYFGNGIRDRRFAIKNIGDSGFVLTGNIVSPSAPFRILTGGGAFSLNSGQTRWVIVSMRPGGPGTYSGKITITSNDSQNSPINVPLSGINDDFVLLQSEPPGGEAQNSPPPADHVIAWGSDEFLRLVRNDNSSIVFAWPRPAFPFEDRYMTPLLAEKVDKLASMVMAEWQGLKLRITAGYDSTGMRHTGKNSTHYEARGVDITVSDRDIRKLGRLARLAKNAGFGWVYYEDALHVHASVSR